MKFPSRHGYKAHEETPPVVDCLEEVERIVGMGHGAWDMVDPMELIRAAWTVSPAAKHLADALQFLNAHLHGADSGVIQCANAKLDVDAAKRVAGLK